MSRKKIIIDTDGGSDDAVAIIMALNDPSYDVVMISTVAGNVPMEQAARNVLTVIEHAGAYEPPVYRGCGKMLFRELECAYDAHGKDGLGDVGFAPKRLKVQEENGVTAMLRMLRESEDGEIDIIALGPLTNLALAARLDEEVFCKSGHIVSMGTAGLGDGNVSPVAEYNIWQDAEAAKIVLESGHEKIMFVGWDACLGDCMLSADEIKVLQESGEAGKFAMECSRQLMELNRKKYGAFSLDLADPVAMAAALHPECIEKCAPYYCQVDISAGPGYGAVMVDKQNILEKKPNACICSKLDAVKFKEYLYRMFGAVPVA